MDIPTQKDIVTSIDDFLDRHAMAPTRFGRDATNNQNIVGLLRRGHQPSLAVLARLKAFMDRVDAEVSVADHDDASTARRDAGAPGKSDEVTAPVTV